MTTSDHSESVEAVRGLTQAVRELLKLGIVRSGRFRRDLGEWYICQLYGGKETERQPHRGWDICLAASGERLRVMTQSYGPDHQWNTLESIHMEFDRLILLIITEYFTIRKIYDVPARELESVVRMADDRKHVYRWDDLEPWRVDPTKLPGYKGLASVIEPGAWKGESAEKDAR